MPSSYGLDSFVIHNGFNSEMRLLAALDTLIGSTPGDRVEQRLDWDVPNVEERLNDPRVKYNLARRSFNHAGQAYLK